MRLEHFLGVAIGVVLLAIGVGTLWSGGITLRRDGRYGVTLPGQHPYVLTEGAAALFGALLCLLGIAALWLTYRDWRDTG